MITDKDPDILFYSVFGVDYRNYNCKRVSFYGENMRPDFTQCDYSFNFDYSDDPRNYRLPLYALFDDVYKLTAERNADELFAQKTKFCNFVYSNPHSPIRNSFFQNLNKYKKVDSGGIVFNNIGYRVPDKHEFMKQYKFTIAFENEQYPGYTTEKIFGPLLVGSVPIYWGNELVSRDFNTNSFLNYHDFSSEKELIEKIIELDNNDNLYLEYLKQTPFTDNRVNEFVDNNNIKSQLYKIVESEIEPVGKKSLAASNNVLIAKPTRVFFKSLYKTKTILKKITKFRFSKLRYKDQEVRKF